MSLNRLLCVPLSSLVIPLVCFAQSYTITTIAGGGSIGPPTFGDGGPATDGTLSSPLGMAFDSAGNLFIAAGLVREISKDGIISTFAGTVSGSGLGDGGPAIQAEMSAQDVAVDNAGNVYIADNQVGRSRIRKVDTTGTITTVTGGFGVGSTGDGGPASQASIALALGLNVDSAGNIYFLDGNLVRRIDTNGVINTISGKGTSMADGIAAINARFSSNLLPDMTLDQQGNLYLIDNTIVRKISAAGVISTVAGNGTATYGGDGGPAVKAGIADPRAVAVDRAGNLYITERSDPFDTSSGDYIRKVTPDGVITTIAGEAMRSIKDSGDGGPALSAQLVNANGIATDAKGDVYFSEISTEVVRMLTPQFAPPAITNGGIVPVYSPSNTIEAGSWISIYGTNLATMAGVWKGDFPQELGGVTVTIDGKAGYLWYAGPNQINLQAPDDNATGSVAVVVTTPQGTASSTVTLAPYAPSFSMLSSKYPAAIVLTPNSPGNSGGGYDIIGATGAFPYASRPVRVGETICIYGVGFGPTDPVVRAGQPFSGSAPSPVLPHVTIGGVDASVTYAGIIEAGLFQVNVVVPAVPAGDQPIVAQIGGASTPSGVMISVQ